VAGRNDSQSGRKLTWALGLFLRRAVSGTGVGTDLADAYRFSLIFCSASHSVIWNLLAISSARF